MNSLKIITDRSDIINKKFKKNFLANVSVKYKFGTCNFEAKVRQSGDWKDHIKISDNLDLLSSLDIKLLEGNILNAVHFKLLIPETRSSEHEILGSLILRYLNFITPETFLVNASINNSSAEFIFQESAEKEMLERNHRREGPIFEGDEKFLWSKKGFNFELENISLVKMRNKRWANQGINSLSISLDAFQKLQESYLNYANSDFSHIDSLSILDAQNPISNNHKKYALLLLGMNGSHGLRPHNRRFYYSPIERKFEPIYYDGNLSLTSNLKKITGKQRDLQIFFSTLTKLDFNQLYSNLQNKPELIKLKKKFLLRTLSKFESEQFFDESIQQLLLNLNNLEIKISDYDNINSDIETVKFNAKNLHTKIQAHELDISTIELISRYNNHFVAKVYNPLSLTKHLETITSEELVNLMADNTFKRSSAILLPNNQYIQNDKFSVNELPFLGGKILFSIGAKPNIDYPNQILRVHQSSLSDWLLLKDLNLNNWTIIFDGSTKSSHKVQEERFNLFGITGCLNFQYVTFNASEIIVQNSQCEDAINIMNSSGFIDLIDVQNSNADGLDIDFSNLEIKNITIIKSQNDCIDFSAGTYLVDTIFVAHCGDKGVSIGEASIFKGDFLDIRYSNIGISSKDLSKTNIDKLELLDVIICAEAIQKKQEFGGGFLSIKNSSCYDKFRVDKYSSIKLN